MEMERSTENATAHFIIYIFNSILSESIKTMEIENILISTIIIKGGITHWEKVLGGLDKIGNKFIITW